MTAVQILPNKRRSFGCTYGYNNIHVYAFSFISESHELGPSPSKNARVSDPNHELRLATGRAQFLNGFDEVHTIFNLAEDDVLAVQPFSYDRRNEKLRAVCILAGVGHG